MNKENLEHFHPEFIFIILVLILASLASSAVLYIQVDGKGSSSSRSRIVKLEQEIRSCGEVLREYHTSLISLSEEAEQLKQPTTSPCDLDRNKLSGLMRSEFDEKKRDEMVDRVERVQSHTDHQHDNNTIAHTFAGCSIYREPSLNVLKPATAHMVEMGRAKLVYIEKPKTPTPSEEEDVYTVTRLNIKKNIHKAKVLNVREEKGRSDKSQGSVNP